MHALFLVFRLLDLKISDKPLFTYPLLHFETFPSSHIWKLHVLYKALENTEFTLGLQMYRLNVVIRL